MATLKGKSFEYEIGDLRIRTTFEDENQLHWEYLAAPDGQTGKNATQVFDRIPIRDNIMMLAWKEADGTQVLDVWDLGRKVLHSNSVSPDDERSSVQAELVQVAPARKK